SGPRGGSLGTGGAGSSRWGLDADEAEEGELVGAGREDDVEVAAAAAVEGITVAGLEGLQALQRGDADVLSLGGDAGVEAEAVLAALRPREGRLALDGGDAENAGAGSLSLGGRFRLLGGDRGAD